jgi:IS30 family transposase
MQSYTHFTLSERENLRILLEQGKVLRQIARELGRNPSTVCREMKRNGKKDGSYNAWWGTSLYLGAGNTAGVITACRTIPRSRHS